MRYDVVFGAGNLRLIVKVDGNCCWARVVVPANRETDRNAVTQRTTKAKNFGTLIQRRSSRSMVDSPWLDCEEFRIHDMDDGLSTDLTFP